MVESLRQTGAGGERMKSVRRVVSDECGKYWGNCK